MGAVKQYLTELQERIGENWDVASQILVRACVLQRCRSCNEVVARYDIVDGETDLTCANKIASALFRDNDDMVLGYELSAVLEAMKAICEECPGDCGCLHTTGG